MLMTISQNGVAPIRLDSNEVNFYRKEGYLFLPGLLDGETAANAREEVLDILQQTRDIVDRAASGTSGQKQKLIQTMQYLPDSTIDSIVNSPNLLSVAAQLMGGASTLYMPFTAVKSGGGGGKFAFHQDNQYTRFTDGLGGINIWFALVPMTPENGCLQICPRSHLRGTLESEAESDGHRRMKIMPEDFLPIRMNAGDAVAFSRLTVHGSGENKTDEPRVGYAIQFHRDDVTAVWDNQPPRLLKGANRWSTAPVPKIAPPDPKGGDGH